MYDITKLIKKSQVEQLLKLLPTPKQRRRGRKRVDKEALLNGILQALVNGVAWEKIAECGCSYSSCWRYFRELQRRGKLKLIFQTLARSKTELITSSIDTTLVRSFDFVRMTGFSGKHKAVGTKVSLLADKDGLPADVQFGKGNKDDKKFVLHHIKNVAGIRKKTLNLDMGYMSIPLRRAMRQIGIRVNMKWREQDFKRKRGPKFKFDKEKYVMRLLLERTNGWVKAFRRLRLRREYLPAMFKAFVYLSLIIILLRQS